MKRSAKMSYAGSASCVAALFYLKRFHGTKHIKLSTWFRLKRFCGTKRWCTQILAVYDARFGKGESALTRLATLRVPFLCSLPEGPLHAS